MRIVDVTVPGGIADQKTYQDPPNNTILQAVRVSSLSVEIHIKAAYPIVHFGASFYTLAEAPDGGHYAGTIAVTLAAAGVITAHVHTPNGEDGAEDSTTVTLDAPPQLLTLQFTGNYPGIQTELKAGDTFQLTGTTDKAADALVIEDFGAMGGSTQTFVSGTSFTVTGVIADRGNVSQLLSAKAQARSATTGALGPSRDTNLGGFNVERADVVRCNNLHPMVFWGTISYPASQGALKNSEQATVAFSMADADHVAFSSPTGDLSINAPNLNEDPKTVTRISGSYNDSTANLRAVSVRDANGAQTTLDTLVKIANVAAVVGVTELAARLRSGGNNGTAPQDHTITITSNQELYAAPSVDAAAGAGTFQGSGFVGGPKVWTRALRVVDTDSKGTFAWTNLAAVNLAGIPTTTITGDANYVLGGFVARTLTFPAFSQSTQLNVPVVDYSKLVAGVFTATNQPAVRTPSQGDTANYANRFTVTALGALPTTLWWNDVAASATNSTGTAAIVAVEEQV